MSLAGKLKKLFGDISDMGNAPPAEEPDNMDLVGSEGVPRESDTPFSLLRHALPVVGMLTPRQSAIAMTPDEAVAWDMLRQHRFSREALREAGELEAYLSLGVTELMEARWQREYMDWLIDHFREHPEGLGEALLLASETGDQHAVERALEAVDDAVSAWELRDGAILDSCLCLLVALKGGRFEPEFAAQARQEALETARRAEAHVREAAPDSPWLQRTEEMWRAAEAGC